jgi:hypothetical protein
MHIGGRGMPTGIGSMSRGFKWVQGSFQVIGPWTAEPGLEGEKIIGGILNGIFKQPLRLWKPLWGKPFSQVTAYEKEAAGVSGMVRVRRIAGKWVMIYLCILLALRNLLGCSLFFKVQQVVQLSPCLKGTVGRRR